MPMRTNNAFTLVEVLITVAIIGIAAGVVVPVLSNTNSLTIQAAGRHVIADLLFAQNDAVAQQKIRRVVFDPTNHRYKVTKPDGSTLGVSWMGGDAATGNYEVDLRDDERFRGVRMENVNFGDNQTIEFDVLGGPDKGGSVDLVNGNFRYRVNVAPITGRVTIAPVTATVTP